MSLQVWLPLNGNIENLGICGDITSTSTPEYTVGKLEKGISLNKRVDFTGLPKLTNFSIFFWARVDSCTTSWSDLLGFTCKQSNDASAAEFRFEATVETRACSWHNNAPFGISSGSRILIQNYEEWHHVGVVYDGENIYSYIDGELTYTDTGLGGYLTTSFHIGETGKFTGALNDLRIYDNCLSKIEVKEISKTLIGHYPLNSGYGNENLMKMGGIVKGNTSSVSYDINTDTYTIKSDFGSTSWIGYTVYIKNTSEISIPYGKSYRASLEVYVPTRHTIVIDVNNNVASGTAWAGNDNDNGSKRTKTSFIIPEKTWTKIVWGSENSNSKNTNKLNILPYDSIGLRTDSDTAPVTWYIRHPKIEIGTEDTEWVPNKADALYSTLGYNSNIEYDTSGYGNNGTKYNNPISVGNSAIGNSCLSFNGTNQYIALGRNCMVRDEITVNLWGYMENWTDFNSPAMRLISCTEGGGWNFEPSNGGLNFSLGVGETSNTYTAAFSSQTINLSKVSSGWHMITGTFDGINKKIYLDGVLKGTISLTEKKTIFYNLNSGIFIGAEDGGHIANPAGNYFKGSISDVRIYATALSDKDIKQLYETKAKIDKNGNLYGSQFIEIDNERNLLDTDDYWISGQTSGTYKQEKIECSDSVSGTATKITCTAAGNGGFYMSGHKVFDKINLVNGKQYCISLYVKSDNRTSVEFNVECKSAQSKTRFTIGTEYRRLCIIYTYSNTTTYSAFTSYGGWKVNENIYIHSLKVTEYNPKSYIKNNSVIETNSFTEISSENETKIYKQDIQTNQIIEI